MRPAHARNETAALQEHLLALMSTGLMAREETDPERQPEL